MKISTLSRNDSNFIKGVCMLLIMFHNYFHKVMPHIGENEFDFDPENFQRFIHAITTSPLNVIRHLSSYLGHYGVQLFIFISSYGLYLSYKDRKLNWLSFMKKRIGKLYPTLVIGIIFVYLLIFLRGNRFPGVTAIKAGLLKFTLLYNFIPGEALSFSGPWWFFSVIIQLYAVFPILLWLTKKYGANSMLATALVFALISMIIDLNEGIDDFSILYTFVGQLPVFSLGVYFAMRKEMNISVGLIFLSLVVFAFGNVNQYVWYFSFLAVTILLLVAILWIFPRFRHFEKINSFIIFTGSISLFLFVIHGSLRDPFIKIAGLYNNPFLPFVLSLAFVAVSYLFALMVRIAEKLFQEYVHSGYKLRGILTRIKLNDY